MQPVSDNVRRSLLTVIEGVLVYARSRVASPKGLVPEQCAELNQLFDITHNIPAFIEGSHRLGFDESWFTGALRRFDQKNRTAFAEVYARARSTKDSADDTHFQTIASF